MSESQSANGFDVGSTLRDRIAAAIKENLLKQADMGYYQVWDTGTIDLEMQDLDLDLLADAVIAALQGIVFEGEAVEELPEWGGR